MEAVIGFFLFLLAIGLHSGYSLHALVLPETDSHNDAPTGGGGGGGGLAEREHQHPASTTSGSVIFTEEKLVPAVVAPFRCPSGFFRCNSTLDCIEQRRNCDGFADCEDGSDERDCDDDVDSSFWDHFFRKRPAALNDHLPFTSCAWNDFNNSCKCRATEVLCDYKDLTTLPTSLPMDNVTLLDLTGNRFPVLNMNVFERLPALDTLVLKYCSIEEIVPPANTLNNIYALTN